MSQKIPAADLIAELQRLADELGHPPGVAELNELGNYAHMTYVRRFGTWNAAVEAAGFEPTPVGGQPKYGRPRRPHLEEGES